MPYQLEIQLPDNEVETIDIVGPCVLGSSDQAELSIQDYDLPNQLCRFRIGQGVLTVTNLGAKKPPLKIGKQVLDHGKMYILDNEDILSYGSLKMIVHELGLDDEEGDEDDNEAHPETGPALDSTAELLAEDENQKDEEKQHPHTKSQSVTEILRQAREGSDKHKSEAPVDKKTGKEAEGPPKQEEKTQETDKPEKTSSKLFEISQKVKSMLGKKETQRAPVKAKSPELVSHKNRKPQNPKRSEGWPGIVPRLLALIIELGGCLLMAAPLAQREEISGQWNVLLEKVDQLALEQPLVVHLSQLLAVLEIQGVLALVLYAFLQIFIGFIFGRSLGYVFMGINEDSGFITKRIKAPLRSLIFLITGPFLIFDLPILFKKRSFKEWFTRSSFYRPSMWPGILSVALIFPTLILGYIVHSSFSKRQSVPIEFVELVPSEVDTRLTFKSLDLRFPVLSLKNNALLPKIDAEKPPKSSGLWIFHSGPNHPPIGLSPGPDYSLKEWAKNFVEYNYALPYINAELSQLIESVSTPGPLSPDKRELLKQLFRDSLSELELNAQNLIQLLKNYGPDIGALNKFSVDIKESLALKEEQQVKWVSFLKRDALWIEQKKEGVLTVQIIFFDTHPLRSIFLTAAVEENEDESSPKEFIQEELIQTLPTFPGPSPKGEELQELSHQASEGMLTLLSQKSTPYEQFDQVYELIFELTGQQLGAPQNIYRETFEKQLQTFIEELNSKRDKNPGENKGLTRFYEKLQKLFQAYQDQKSSFFVEQ